MNTDTRLIPLTQGKFSIVDAIDYEWLMQWKWHAAKFRVSRGYLWYAKRHDGVGNNDVWMHRAIAERAGIINSPKYDHRDRDGLNNKRENIRPCTHSQNLMNKSKALAKTSRYKGVYWSKLRKTWRSTIGVHGKIICLGTFRDEQQASNAYISAATKYFGEWACVESAPVLA